MYFVRRLFGIQNSKFYLFLFGLRVRPWPAHRSSGAVTGRQKPKVVGTPQHRQQSRLRSTLVRVELSRKELVPHDLLSPSSLAFPPFPFRINLSLFIYNKKRKKCPKNSIRLRLRHNSTRLEDKEDWVVRKRQEAEEEDWWIEGKNPAETFSAAGTSLYLVLSPRETLI